MRLYADNGNDQEAVKWALKAAEQQNPQAQYFLAQHYQYSSSPDLEYSHKLYQQSAAQGFIAAHWQLGLQYKLGQGVAQNPEKAIEHLRIAADSVLRGRRQYVACVNTAALNYRSRLELAFLGL
ncbi:TPA: tetratricopeptide repeat protein [Neisseria subflava]